VVETEPVLRFPVICPSCASECLSESAVASIAAALLRGSAIPLHCMRDGFSWNAGKDERAQIRAYLAAAFRN
jgi:hypothetical protein